MAKRFSTFNKNKNGEQNYQYFIDEEKGVVVAKIGNLSERFRDEAHRMWNCDPWSFKSKDTIVDIVINQVVAEFFQDREKELHDSLTAKAVCMPEDTFDADFGMKIAERKLELRILEMWIDFNMKIENTLASLADEAYDMTEIAAEAYGYREEKFYEMFEQVD